MSNLSIGVSNEERGAIGPLLGRLLESWVSSRATVGSLYVSSLHRCEYVRQWRNVIINLLYLSPLSIDQHLSHPCSQDPCRWCATTTVLRILFPKLSPQIYSVFGILLHILSTSCNKSCSPNWCDLLPQIIQYSVSSCTYWAHLYCTVILPYHSLNCNWLFGS